MADGITIKFEDAEVESMIKKLLRRVHNPKKLMLQVQKYVHAVTMQMFHGGRADTRSKRGQVWKKLKPETLKQKAALKKRGMAIEIQRPLVRTGAARDSLKVLSSQAKGFTYGTNIKSKTGFPYMGAHQKGAPPIPQRKSIFLGNHDLRQVIKMTVDYLKGIEIKYKGYLKK